MIRGVCYLASFLLLALLPLFILPRARSALVANPLEAVTL
jgi:hypothetical protein